MIDLNNNDQIDWQAVWDSGHHSVIFKITEGLNYANPMLAQYLQQATAIGFVIGGYHFYHPDEDSEAQAQFCHDTAAAAGFDFANSMPIWADLENYKGDKDPNNDLEKSVGGQAHIRLWMEHFSDAIQNLTGKLPGIYGSKDYLESFLGTDGGFAGHPLWFARFNRTMGDLPTGWANWTIWQYSERGTVDGIPAGAGQTDLNTYNGSEQDLRNWVSNVPE